MARYTQHHAGFSMVEIIIVVSIIAILAGMLTPAFIQFLNSKTAQEEAATMAKIQESLDVFARTYGKLPYDDADNPSVNNAFCDAAPNSWADCLAIVSDLTPTEILNDAWGHPRAYMAARDASGSYGFINGTSERFYVTVMSRGIDQNVAPQAGVASELDGRLQAYSAPSTNGWWRINKSNLTQLLNAYYALEALEDDFLIKFSDAEMKQEQYKKTLTRIHAVNEALASYAAARFTLARSKSEVNAEKKTYYPVSRSTGAADNFNNNYGNDVKTDMTTAAFGGDRMIENRVGSSYESTRVTEMKNLMRLLGLPDSYCCNAMERISDNPTQEAPFYYYSNPRGRTGSGCIATRASAGDTAPYYLDAKIQVESYPCP